MSLKRQKLKNLTFLFCVYVKIKDVDLTKSYNCIFYYFAICKLPKIGCCLFEKKKKTIFAVTRKKWEGCTTFYYFL